MGVKTGYSSQNSNYNNTNTTTKNLTPYQTAIQPSIFKTISDFMSNPQMAVAPSAQAARDQVNRSYAGLGDRVRQQFLTTGGGKSGKAGAADLQGELARAGGLADVDTTAQVQASQLPLTAAQLGEQFLGQTFGQTTTGTGTSSQSGWGVSGSAGVSGNTSSGLSKLDFSA